MPQEAARGLEPEQPTADDHRILAARRIGGDLVAVLESAEDEEPFLGGAVLPLHPLHRRLQRARAGGEDDGAGPPGPPAHALRDPSPPTDARRPHAALRPAVRLPPAALPPAVIVE